MRRASSLFVTGLGAALAAASFGPGAAIAAPLDSAPLAPVVSSLDFPECSSVCPHTGNHVGETGTFQLEAATGDVDVDAYRWSVAGAAEGEPAGWSEPVATKAGKPRSIAFTPTASGLRTVSFQAHDKADSWGSVATYTFYVPRNAPQVAWSFDDPNAPGANTGQDPAVGDLNLGGAATSPLGRNDIGLRFNAGEPATATSGISTANDFTVALWAHVDAAESMTLVSATSPEGNALEIGYDASTRSWVAGRRSATSAELASVAGSQGTWTHLAVTYRAAADELTLWVDGVARSSVTYASEAWDSSSWTLGCGGASTTGTACATAMVDEVGIWDNAAIGSVIAERVALQTSDGYATSMAAEWNLGVSTDTVESGVLTDRSFGARLQVEGAGSQYLSDGVLSLPGLPEQSITSNHPLTDSAVAFSAAASVRLTDPTRPAVIAQQAGESATAWTLGYRVKSDGTGGQFYFRIAGGDRTDAEVAEVRADVWTPEDVNVVIGVYNAERRQIEIYLNGLSPQFGDGSAEGEMPVASFTTPWTARGGFEVGNGTTTADLAGPAAPLAGELVGVWQYAGALSANDIFNADPGLPPGAAGAAG
ncbi:LamG domain-containing protein [Nocardioides sp. NBC_00368]|uniref:LamG-like jellyroll fold domain-containing protein n=1 Tax=Nocardioides sp. NBC_00368 TaxID=2976000 RepID=UPI002E1E0E56